MKKNNIYQIFFSLTKLKIVSITKLPENSFNDQVLSSKMIPFKKLW